jgi:membrane fusion protein, multidrug efflux system
MENHMYRHQIIFRNLAIALAMLGAALAAGCARQGAGPPPGPAEVGTVKLAQERVVLTSELPGRTAPYLVAEVRPQVSGLLQRRHFEEGAQVRAGELLYQIDPAPYRAATDAAAATLAMAEANLPAARARAGRLRSLAASHAVGEQDVEDAEAAFHRAEASVTASRAALESARINSSWTPIKAPISGRTGRSSVTVGALVTAYQPVPLVTIQQLDPIYVDVQQSSAELLRLRRVLSSGQLSRDAHSAGRVHLVLEDGTTYAHEGVLKFQDVTVEPTTGSVTLRMVFPNPDYVLLPGMFVRAIVEEGVDSSAILAPQQGVSRDSRGNALALVLGPEGRVEQRTLELGRALGDRWLVTSGLAAGDQLIVDGLQRVRPGMPARAVPVTNDATLGHNAPTGAPGLPPESALRSAPGNAPGSANDGMLTSAPGVMPGPKK